MHFTNLRLSNWRNFSSVDTSLSPRMFLIGPNASGKSNLLDVFRFLRDISKADGGFQQAVTARGGISLLRCLSARRYSDIAVEVEVGGTEWRYRIHFNQDSQRRPILKREQVWRQGRKLLDRPDEPDKADPARLTQTHLEQVYVNQEFRDLARFFETVQYQHLVPHIVRDPERVSRRRATPSARISSSTSRPRRRERERPGSAESSRPCEWRCPNFVNCISRKTSAEFRI